MIKLIKALKARIVNKLFRKLRQSFLTFEVDEKNNAVSIKNIGWSRTTIFIRNNREVTLNSNDVLTISFNLEKKKKP